MNKYVKIDFNGKISPYLLYVDENHIWSNEDILAENAKSVEIAKMAFLDHGEPLIPLDDLSLVLNQKAGYLTPAKGIVFLVYEGGNYMTLIPDMKIIEEVHSDFYPIPEGFAVICENDPFDKDRLSHIFDGICKTHKLKGHHYLFNFRNRTEAELIHAFKNAPAILFMSSYTSVDWWELMIRCIIKSKTKALVIGSKPYSVATTERYNKFIQMAAKFDVNVITN